MSTPAPPTVAALTAAAGPKATLGALIHLALPVTDVVGVHATLTSVLAWRGHETPVPAAVRPVELARSVLGLVEAARRPEDRFCDLAAPASTWVKVLRSGSYQVWFGAPALFGVHVRAALDVPDTPDVRDGVLAAAAASDVPGLVTTRSGTWLLEGSPVAITVQAALAASPTAPAVLDPWQVAVEVAADADGTPLAVSPTVPTGPLPADVEVLVRAQGRVLRVPVRATSAAWVATTGPASPGAVRAGDLWALPVR